MAFLETISADVASREEKAASTIPPVQAAKPDKPAIKAASSPDTTKETRPGSAESKEVTGEDAITNQRLDKNWNLVLAQIRIQNPNLYALVNSASPVC